MSRKSNLKRKKNRKEFAKSRKSATQRKEHDFSDEVSVPLPDFIGDDEIIEFSDNIKDNDEII